MILNKKDVDLTKKEVRLVERNLGEGMDTLSFPDLKDEIYYYLELKMKFNNKGYINLVVGKEKSDDIKIFSNKKYVGNPFSIDSINNIDLLEIYNDIDDEFLDSEIESNVSVTFGNIENNKIKVDIELNDKLITLDIDEYFDII